MGSPRKPSAQSAGGPPPGAALQHPGSMAPARPRGQLGRPGSARENAPRQSSAGACAVSGGLGPGGRALTARAPRGPLGAEPVEVQRRADAVLSTLRAACSPATEAQTFCTAGFSPNQLNRPGGRPSRRWVGLSVARGLGGESGLGWGLLLGAWMQEAPWASEEKLV